MLVKIKKVIAISLLVLSVGVVPVLPAAAAPQPTNTDPVAPNDTGGNKNIPGATPCAAQDPSGLTFFPAWYDGLLCKDGSIKSPTDTSLGKDTGARFGTWLTIIAMNIVRMLLFATGYVSLIFIFYGGFKYMTQGDNSSGTVSARKTIQNAVIGLIISIMAVSIVTFVVQRVSSV